MEFNMIFFNTTIVYQLVHIFVFEKSIMKKYVYFYWKIIR
jgi:hypothetical protein